LMTGIRPTRGSWMEWRSYSNGVVAAKAKVEEIKRHLKTYDENREIPASTEDLFHG